MFNQIAHICTILDIIKFSSQLPKGFTRVWSRFAKHFMLNRR